MSKSTKKEREVIQGYEDKGVREQISNLHSQTLGKSNQPVKFSDTQKSNPLSQDVPLSSDPRHNVNLQQQSGSSQTLQSRPPIQDLSAEKFNKERENLFTKTSPATERNIVYLPKSSERSTLESGDKEPSKNLETGSKETWKLDDKKKDLKEGEERESEKKEGGITWRKSDELSYNKDTSTVAPPQSTVTEGEMLSQTFSQLPDINEEKIREYLMNALSFLKEAEETMVEKFAEARKTIMDMHPQEKLSHAVDVTKDKAWTALGVAIEETSVAKEGIKHTYEKVRDTVAHVTEKVSEAAKSSYDVLKVKINELSHKSAEELAIAKEKWGEYSHKAQEIYETTKHKVQESEITHMAQEVYETAKHKVQESDLAHKAQDVYESTKHKLGDLQEGVVEFLTEPTDQFHEAAVRVRESVEEDRELQLRREREEREKRESLEEERERQRLLKEDDDNTRIKLMSEEAPQSLPK